MYLGGGIGDCGRLVCNHDRRWAQLREEHQADRREKERLLSLLGKQTLLLPQPQEATLLTKKRHWWRWW